MWVEEGLGSHELTLLILCSVSLNSESAKPGYVMRDLTVQRVGNKTKRRLFQLQFTGWPDHGEREGEEGLNVLCSFY